jgi:hypothetical protein
MNDEGFTWLIGVAMWLFCIARSAWLFNSPCRSVLVVPNASMKVSGQTWSALIVSAKSGVPLMIHPDR